jgi:hypothetical protein
MFSLAKLAYCVCDDDERIFYNNLETLIIDIQPCCIDVLRYLKNETRSNVMDVDFYSDGKFKDNEGKRYGLNEYIG